MNTVPDSQSPDNGDKKTFYADTTRKPDVLPLNPDGIPTAMRDAPRWVGWKLVLNNKKWTKVPVQVCGRNASSTNPKTWATFAEVLVAYHAGKFDGIGFVLGDGFAGIDLDDVRDRKTGELVPWASDLVTTATTYAEVSPSGTGVKVYGQGKWVGKWHKRRHPSGTGDIEVYDAGRFFIVTGHTETSPAYGLTDIQPALDNLAGLFAPPSPPPVAPSGAVDMTDDALVELARRSRQGDKFSRLWAGDTSGNGGDDSAADLALCGILCFWCGPNSGRIDRLFRQSKLMRDKWDERRGDRTYGQRTVETAVASCSEWYDPTTASGRYRRNRPTDPRPVAGAVDRPSILLTTEEHEVNAAALAALTREPDVYQRGGLLVHVTHEPSDCTVICKPVSEPKVRELPKPLLREVLTRVACWQREKASGGDVTTVPAHPPTWAVDAVHARGQWPGVRRLEAVVTHPVMLRDGTFLTANGYHPPSGLLVALPAGLSVTVPDAPTRADVDAAVETLLDPLTDFPFATHSHRAAFLAALLTPLAWFAFEGPAPLFLIEANVRGAGKGLLADVIAITMLGRRFSPMTYTNDKDELRKRITTLAVEGDRLALLDNITGVVGNDVLDAALTTSYWKDRKLGSNQSYDGPLNATWYGTGNNVQFLGDTPRRVLPIRLESQYERPELRNDLKYPDLRAYVPSRRGLLLSAALTILRAYLLAGRPKHGLAAWGSYEQWSDLVREAVVFAGLPDPGLTREGLHAVADQDAALMGVILDGLARMDSRGKGMTAAELVERMSAGPREEWAELRAAVEELCGKADATAIGYKFREFRSRNFGGRMLSSEPSGKHAARWQVRHAGGRMCRTDTPHAADPRRHTPPAVGDGGDVGHAQAPPEPTSPPVLTSAPVPVWEDADAFNALLERAWWVWSAVLDWLSLPAETAFSDVPSPLRQRAADYLEGVARRREATAVPSAQDGP